MWLVPDLAWPPRHPSASTVSATDLQAEHHRARGRDVNDARQGFSGGRLDDVEEPVPLCGVD